MSEIDRIAYELFDDFCHSKGSVTTIRAALLEYGAIVREECAKEAEAHIDVPMPGYPHTRMWKHFGNEQVAAAIRRMNDANKG